MCGIVAYVGHRPARDVVVDALRRMEYRGYDSAGIAVLDPSGRIVRVRAPGKLSALEDKLKRLERAEDEAASGRNPRGSGDP